MAPEPHNGAVYIYSSARVGELPYVMGRVGQTPAKLLVDSGAGATLVHKKLVPSGKYEKRGRE